MYMVQNVLPQQFLGSVSVNKFNNLCSQHLQITLTLNQVDRETKEINLLKIQLEMQLFIQDNIYNKYNLLYIYYFIYFVFIINKNKDTLFTFHI